MKIRTDYRAIAPLPIEIAPSFYALKSDSIVSVRANEEPSFFSFKTLLFPVVFVGRLFAKIGRVIRDNLFPFCKFTIAAERMDWVETKEICDAIKESLTKEAPSLDRDEKVKKLLKQLSEPAILRLREYVGFTFARIEGKATDRADQERWINQNRNSITFDNPSFFFEAIRSFTVEIDRQQPIS